MFLDHVEKVLCEQFQEVILMTERITTKHLSIVDDDGKEVASLCAADGGAGLWINSPDGGLITIFAVNGQTGIGYYDKFALLSGDPMIFAILAGQDGPSIQVCGKDGSPVFITADKLIKIASTPLA